MAARELQKGDVIFVDRAIACAGVPTARSAAARVFAQVSRLCSSDETASPYKDWDVATMWCALHSLLESEVPHDWPLPTLTSELQEQALLLFSSGRSPTASTQQVQATLRLSIAPAKLERLVDVWQMNSFGHTSHDDVNCLFFAPALSNHSCMPTASWYISGEIMAFRANSKLAVGDEITDSYLNDEDLLASTPWRRRKILDSGKGFICYCQRCAASVDRSRGVPCPQCRAGVVFLGHYKSGVEDMHPTRLAQHDSNCCSACCSTCGYRLSKKEHGLVIRAEAKVSKLANIPRDEVDTSSIAFEKLRQTMASHLGETTHWLSRVVHGLLKIRAEEAGDMQGVLKLLDLRAAFVRNAFGISSSASNEQVFVACPSHALELEEAAARLCMIASGPRSRRHPGPLKKARKTFEAAHWRLQECLEILIPILGPQAEIVTDARQLLEHVQGTLRVLRTTLALCNRGRGLKRLRRYRVQRLRTTTNKCIRCRI